MLRAHPLERVPRLSVEAFRRDYVLPRTPVVLPQLVSSWPATSSWSLDSLQTRFAMAEVTTIRAEAGRVIMDGDGGAVEKRMPLGEFIDALRGGCRNLYVTTRLNGLPQDIRSDVPPPPHCSQAAWQTGNLWIGPAGTIARIHRDLADNLHAIVRGRKRFTLVSPQHSSGLYPHRLFDAFPNGCRVDIEEPDFALFPKLRSVETLVADLNAGDAIYIPRRWWHHVRTLDLTVSVNYWWADGLRRAVVLAADYFKRARGISR